MTLEDILQKAKKKITTGALIAGLAASIFATKPNSKIITPSHHIITNSKQIELPKPGQLFAYNFPTNYDIEEQKAAEIMANIALRRINPSNEWSRVNTSRYAINIIRDLFDIFRAARYYNDVNTNTTMFNEEATREELSNADRFLADELLDPNNKPIIAEYYLANSAMNKNNGFEGRGTPPLFGKVWMMNTTNILKWLYVNQTEKDYPWGESMEMFLIPAWDAVKAEMYNFPGPVNPLIGTYFTAFYNGYHFSFIVKHYGKEGDPYTTNNVTSKSLDDTIDHLLSIENKNDLYSANPNIDIGLAQMDTIYMSYISSNVYKDEDGNWQLISNSQKEELTQEYISKLEQNIQKAYDKMMDYANNPNNPFRKYVRDKWGDEGVIIEAYQMLKAFQFAISQYKYAIPLEYREEWMKKYLYSITKTYLIEFPEIYTKRKWTIALWYGSKEIEKETYNKLKSDFHFIEGDFDNVYDHPTR